MDLEREHVLNVLLARIRLQSPVEAKTIGLNALKRDDVIILLMGPPGSGKTTFLEITAGAELVGRKKSEHPATSISAFKLSVPDFPGSIVLVNTPAFNNVGKGDLEILRMLSDWVNQTYKNGILVSGLIYFHRISDAQMEGVSLRNWRAFEKFCGDHFHNVVLATTMWGGVDPRLGDRRTEELQDSCGVMARGWTIRPFHRDHTTAADLLLPILERTTPRQPLQLQREISHFHLSPKQTTVARALLLELQTLLRSTKQKIQRTLAAFSNKEITEEQDRDLEAECHELDVLVGLLRSRIDDLKETHASKIQRRILLTRVLGYLVRLLYSNRAD
jgi:energy-coupling factor transporter ATP-binding protein EcfA2